MMMTMIVLNKHVDGADCCLISTVLGVRMKKNYIPITILSNVCKYCPVLNNPISVSF